MTSIKDEVRIRTTPARAYAALTEQSDYRGWWNKVAEVPGEVGGEPKLLFNKEGQLVSMQYRIDTLTPNELVKWTCIAHDMASWVGTTLTWTIKPAGDEVLVALDHARWQGEGPQPVAQGWRHFLGSLKSYLETGVGQPW
jgi:uncharacterized protein YndB with AHSA1/START domain